MIQFDYAYLSSVNEKGEPVRMRTILDTSTGYGTAFVIDVKAGGDKYVISSALSLLKELWWPAHFLAIIRAKDSIVAESIWSKLDGGVVIESDYSGMRCMEQAAAMIRQTVELQSSSPRRCLEVHWMCATATRGAAMCFDVMQQREGIASAVSHDICDPIDPCSFATMQGASR